MRLGMELRSVVVLVAALSVACADDARTGDGPDGDHRRSNKRIPSASGDSAARMSQVAAVDLGAAQLLYWVAGNGTLRLSRRDGAQWSESELVKALPWAVAATVLRGDVHAFFVAPDRTVRRLNEPDVSLGAAV